MQGVQTSHSKKFAAEEAAAPSVLAEGGWEAMGVVPFGSRYSSRHRVAPEAAGMLATVGTDIGLEKIAQVVAIGNSANTTQGYTVGSVGSDSSTAMRTTV